MANKKKKIKSAGKPQTKKSQADKNRSRAQNEKKFDTTSIVLLSVFLAVIAAVLILVFVFVLPQGGSESEESSAQQNSITASDLDLQKEYSAEIKIKGYGTISLKLEPSQAPITVANFINLANSGFYDGLTFHRIIEGFMMQGGDPKGDGSGDSEPTIKGEFKANGVENSLSHTRGAISMARLSYDYNSASSQFFIVQTDNHVTSLDGQYAAFGYVTEGMEIVDRICKDAKPTDNNGTIDRLQQPVMESVRVTIK